MENKLPWEEAAMAASSHAQLSNKRGNATTKEEQNAIAPYEHRAYARETVADSPLAAIPLAVMTPVYQASKAIGLEASRSDPSMKQVTEAYKGIGEGLAASVKKPWEEAQEQARSTIETVTNAVKKILPWEQAQQVPNRVGIVTKPVKSQLGGDWDAINAKSIAGQDARNQVQLDTLKAELAAETKESNKTILKREIKRVEATIKKGGYG